MKEIMPFLDPSKKTPLYIQLADHFKKEITDGNLKANEKLPAKRALSVHLGLSLNTVQSAYDQLHAEGYVESVERKGLYVKLAEDHLQQLKTQKQRPISKPIRERTYRVDFNSGHVDTAHFPYAIWKKLSAEALHEEQQSLLQTGNPQGEFHLRRAIAGYLYESRGVKCEPDQIVIGAGTQVLMNLLCLLIGKEHGFAVENPGFHRTRTVLKHHGIRMIPVPLDQAGISVSHLHMTEARTVYVTPSHQFPRGMVMPVSRRMELLKWAQETDSFIIEDDYDGEYRYKGRPIPALQGLDGSGRVFYLGTFSKSMIPSIRLSYFVMPPDFIRKYQEELYIYKQSASRLHQDALFRFIDEGHWQRHLNKMRTLYRRKHAVLMDALHLHLKDQVEIIGEKSGLHIVLNVKNGLSEEKLIAAAAEKDIKVYPISVYDDDEQNCQSAEILLGFGGLSEAEIREGIRLLAEAWK